MAIGHDKAITLPQKAWLVQKIWHSIGRALGLVGTQIGFSREEITVAARYLAGFMLAFPPATIAYYLVAEHTLILSVPLLMTFVSGVAASKMIRDEGRRHGK